jgi:hypothetical protein
MSLTDRQVEFLEKHHSAAMITVTESGVAKVARIGVALLEGRLWSSATQDRTRTKRLRRDPRSTLFVFEPGFAWLALETTVDILDGPDAPEKNLQLMRLMQNRPTGPLTWFGEELDEKGFLDRMTVEKRLVYQFNVHRAYGLH